jgi:hypothetical protein
MYYMNIKYLNEVKDAVDGERGVFLFIITWLSLWYLTFVYFGLVFSPCGLYRL